MIKIENKYFLPLLVLLFFLLHPAYAYDEIRLRIAVFPFNDMNSKTLDLNIPLVLSSELSGYEFIEIVPVETITKRLYEIKPSLLWTEKNSGKERGGILWTIQPKVIEEVNKNVSAEFSIYGDLTRFGDAWRIDSYIIEGTDSGKRKSFTITGLKDNEIPEKLSELAKLVTDWLREKNVLHEAEEYVRRYMGGTYTYPVVLEKMKGLVKSFPESIHLHALLIDLYLKQKPEYGEEIIQEGLKVISLYDPKKEDTTRYLLSLNLDPFDVIAEIYEDRLDLEKALSIRNKAIEIFPYRTGVHKEGLGKDCFLIAQIFEKKDQKSKALESYEKALSYLAPSSMYYKKATEGINRLKERSR